MATEPANTFISSNAKLTYLPQGTALPTTIDAPLTGGEEIGLTSSDGETWDRSVTVENFDAHQNDGDTVRQKITEGERTLSLVAIEDKPLTRSLFWGTKEVGGVIRSKAKAAIEGVWVYDTFDEQEGYEKAQRYVFEGIVVPNGSTTNTNSAIKEYPLSITARGEMTIITVETMPNPSEPVDPTPNPNQDSDNDGLTDVQETTLGTNKNLADTDGDSYSDKAEVDAGTDPLDALDYPGSTPPPPVDSDGDGLTNAEEAALGTNPNQADSDTDGYTDKQEVDAGTDPLDALDYPGATPPPVDSDGDGYFDEDEIAAGTNPNDPNEFPGSMPPEEDSDADGLTDAEEAVYGTDPNMPDTDNDGYTDKDEVDAGRDPLNRRDFPGSPDPDLDSDGDGYMDVDEILAATDPYDPDSNPANP